MEQDNRESWLNRVAIGMAPLFEALDAPLPARVCAAITFTSRGAKGKAIGECWDNRCSGAGHSPFCPVEDHGPMRHNTLDDDGQRDTKRLISFTNKRLSGISRLAA